MSATAPATRTVRVALGDGRGYDVVIGSGILAQVPGRVQALFQGDLRPCFMITDDGVPGSFIAALTNALPLSKRKSWVPTEHGKVLLSASAFLEAMGAANMERGCPVLAVGGGITGDMAGFVAALFQRGTPWINCPTTLLAMVDASVGGKTGVNLQVTGESTAFKNLVGAFHQPILVIADVATLASLPERTYRAGLAECLKHGLLSADWGDPSLLDWFQANLPGIKDRNVTVLTELVARNIAVKAAVVAADEQETGQGAGGGRMALNLGHTFAHAIETLPGLATAAGPGSLHHGEAVALGLIAAAACGGAAGVCSPNLGEEVKQLIAACGLPTWVSGLPDDALILSRMLHDKKVKNSKLRLILPTSRGRVAVFANPPAAAVSAGLAAIRSK